MGYIELFKALEQIDKEAKIEKDNNRYDFNIFTILRKHDEEVGLHSQFLAELLNPKGGHGLPIFQKLFIDNIINPAIAAQDWNRELLDSGVFYDCKTEEHHAGFGRIDIILKSLDKIIVIENKIHAADQRKQLERYFEACLKLGYLPKNIYILYLNKYGATVTEHSRGNLRNDDFGCITYKNDIRKWLGLCAIESTKYPHIEHTLLQYKRLVGSLTGDKRTDKMKKSHVNLLYQSNTFKLAYELSQSFDKFQIDLQTKIWHELINSFKNKGYDFSFCDKNLQSCDENKKVRLYYEKDNKNSRLYGIQYKLGTKVNYGIHCFIQLNHRIYYGITVSNDNMRVQYPDNLLLVANKFTALNQGMRSKESRWFLGGNVLPLPEINFKKPESLYEIIDDEDRKEWVNKTTNGVIEFIEKVKALELIEEG